MTTRVANAETIRVCQRNGEIDTLECLPRLGMVQVVEPGRDLQDVGVSTSLHLWACPAKRHWVRNVIMGGTRTN
jgi:hypothetical protein